MLATATIFNPPDGLPGPREAPEWWSLLEIGAIAMAIALVVLLYFQRRAAVRALRQRAREHEIVVSQARRLAEVDELKSRLFANLSHELRTPLTLALGPLKDLERGDHGPLGPEVAWQVALARSNAERLLALVEELLDLARSESGRLEIRARRLDLASFLEEQYERFAGLADRQGIDYRFISRVESVEIWADPTQIEKLFANLLSNALRHTARGGVVELTLEDPSLDGTVAASVRDDGEGIPEDEQELIFDRFYRVDRSLHRAEGGTGLGLPLAREIAELHGGELTVSSEVGAGSLFRVELKLGSSHFAPSQLRHPESAAEEPGPPLAEPGTGLPEAAEPAFDLPDDRTTILVVDDHPDVRGYVRRHLEPRFRVVEAANGARGLRQARRSTPDLVVTDLLMPEMDGLELVRRLKADPELEYVPVVLLTAKDSRESRIEGLEAEADDYLTKPFEALELLARIDNLIRQRRRLRERFGAGAGAAVELPVAPKDRLDADDRALLERVRGAIDENLGDEEFNVAKLATQLAMDRTHLFRRVKTITGRPPSELILEMRLARAAQLLERGEGGVGEVAVAVGFKSVSHFGERFRRSYGASPSAFARSGGGAKASS